MSKEYSKYLMIISPGSTDCYIYSYETIEQLKEAVLNGDNFGNEYIIAKKLDIEIIGE